MIKTIESGKTKKIYSQIIFALYFIQNDLRIVLPNDWKWNHPESKITNARVRQTLSRDIIKDI